MLLTKKEPVPNVFTYKNTISIAEKVKKYPTEQQKQNNQNFLKALLIGMLCTNNIINTENSR